MKDSKETKGTKELATARSLAAKQHVTDLDQTPTSRTTPNNECHFFSSHACPSFLLLPTPISSWLLPYLLLLVRQALARGFQPAIPSRRSQGGQRASASGSGGRRRPGEGVDAARWPGGGRRKRRLGRAGGARCERDGRSRRPGAVAAFEGGSAGVETRAQRPKEAALGWREVAEATSGWPDPGASKANRPHARRIRR